MANVKNFCMEMEVPEISKMKSIWLPEFPINGIPWYVKVCKEEKDAEQSLGVYLYCANEDKSPNWSLWGTASLKLLPFSDDAKPIKHHIRLNVFDSCSTGYGTSNLIEWNDLFNQDKKYVKGDTIKMKIEVMAENPNDPHRSRLNVDCVQRCCDNNYFVRFTVTNIMNLTALQTPRFTLRGLPWNLKIYKPNSSHIGVMLELKEKSEKVTCKVSVKLISSNENVHQTNTCTTEQYQLENKTIMKVFPLDTLLKPELGFVNNNSITMEVEIKVEEPEGIMPIAKRAKLNPEVEDKSPQMECPICLKCIANQELSVTPCGHLFCLECIKKAIRGRAACPACNKAVRSNTLRRLYLPVVN